MATPIAIFVGCFLVGSLASASWLPELDGGRLEGLVFFVVCGMAGAAAGSVGLHVYELVEVISRGPGGYFLDVSVSAELEDMLWQAGVLLGVALGVYTLVALRRPPRESHPPAPAPVPASGAPPSS